MDQSIALFALRHLLKAARTALLAVAFFATLLLSSSQTLAKGDGFKIGNNGRFHPKVTINGGYDNNVFHRSHQTQAGNAFAEIIGAPFLSIRPGLELIVDSKSFGFTLAGFANYSHFFNISSTSATKVDNLNTVTAKVDLGLHFLRDKPVSISITNNFSRGSGSSSNALENFDFRAGTQNGSAFITHDNIANILLSFKPGGGALSIDLGYTFGLHFYPSDNLDFNQHTLALAIKWTFFPRTALTFDANFSFVNYNPGLDFSRASDVNNNSLPFNAYVGIVGQLTERILISFRIGGGYTLTQQTASSASLDNFGMVVGNLDITYKIRLTTYFRAGFRNGLNPSLFSDFQNETVGYLEFGSQFGPPVRPFVFNIKAEGGLLTFGKIPTSFGGATFNATNLNSDGTISRQDTIVRATATFDWFPYKWWKIGIQGNFEFRNSNTFVVSGSTQIGLGYIKFMALLVTEFAF